MKAAVLHAPGEIRIEERERPEPGPREVLVQRHLPLDDPARPLPPDSESAPLESPASFQ